MGRVRSASEGYFVDIHNVFTATWSVSNFLLDSFEKLIDPELVLGRFQRIEKDHFSPNIELAVDSE